MLIRCRRVEDGGQQHERRRSCRFENRKNINQDSQEGFTSSIIVVDVDPDFPFNLMRELRFVSNK